MDYKVDLAIDKTFQLNGDSIPYNMKSQLFKDKGNDMDLKCCHCGIFYGKRKSLDEEASNL